MPFISVTWSVAVHVGGYVYRSYVYVFSSYIGVVFECVSAYFMGVYSCVQCTIVCR